ncbi:gp58-like family protein [uncultured Limosilactobacillus sp.]|uniref:gp58-like family protein n=1 Tax=uncultured Limosilactobacillus sp. TaxID=2837629 RepID=UPI00272BE66B|nr:gp58-like family protein [uncultured Limosilactobacillus sp.]
MAENNQLSDETKNNSTDTSSTDASSAVIGNHENAVAPHKISNHDKLVQTMVMVDGEWINVNDTNDQANMKEDMHKVNKKVVEAQKGIVEAKNTADSAVKYADSAVSASKVNSDAIVAQSSAISEAKAAADDAASKAQAVKENAASEAAAIRNQVVNVANNVSSVKADVASATSDVANLKVDVQANSAAIIKTNEAVSVQSKSSSDAINELKIANGQVESIAKDAQNNATVAKQTADTATTLAQDAKNNAVLATQTATSATVEATNASSAAAKAELSVNGLTTRVTAIEGDNKKFSNQITSTETILQQTKDQLLQKADKSVVDQANNLISQLSAEQKTMAGQISQKVSSSEYQTLRDKVNGINVGGRNLAVNTDQEYTMGFGIPNTTWKDGFAYAPLPTTGGGGEILPQDPHTFWYGLMPGQEYTQTIWFQTDADIIDVNAAQITWFTYVGHDYQPAEIQKLGNNNYKIFSTYKWPGKSNNSVRLFDIANLNRAVNLKSGSYLKFGKVKLEVGDVSTDYSPNPDDTIAAISKNTTAIDENSKAIKLKADATEVNNLKGTVNSHSASINLFSDRLKSMVTESKVNDIINGKGFATQSTVQSIVNQKAGQLSESITQLDTTFKTGMENSVQLVRKSDFEDGSKGNWTVHAVVSATNPAPPAELGQPGMKVLQTNTRDGYEDGIWYSVKPGEKFDVDYWCAPSPAFHTTFGLLFVDKNKNNYNWQGISSDQSGQWKHYIGTITAPPNASFAKPWYQMEKPANNTENSSWLAKPSIRRQNASTVNAIQTLTASIDGLQSAVTNYQKDASSKYTQLSDLMQSKVNKGELESVRTQLASSINERIQKGNLITQFNLEAGRTLIQSNKIYFDAESFVMSPNSKAFIPSAYITNINADKITTGTLDAAKFNVKNFSADNITGGTLNGVVVKTGANDRYFQTSKDNIYWVRKGSMSLVGNAIYLNSANGFNIADEKNIQLTTWGGATVNKDGSITNDSGNSGHPKIVIDDEGKYNPDDIYGSAFGGGPGDSEIAQWVGNKEYTALTRNQGFTVHLNDGNNKSIFAIQKDNKVGFYVGGGDDGGEIRIAGAGPIKLQGKYIDDGFNDGMTHTLGNLQVDNLHVRKWLGVDQSKNAIVKTSQGPVTINAYETAEYYFGDIGEGQTSADGIAYIGIEKLFHETVNTTIPYHVFITAYGPGNIWVDQREHNRFIVKSDQPNLKFSWEIKAKRKGYEHTRLQNVDDKLTRMAATS